MIRDFLRDIPAMVKVVLIIFIIAVVFLNHVRSELEANIDNDFLTRRLVEAEKKALHGDTRLISKLNMDN